MDLLLHNGDLMSDKYGDIAICKDEYEDVIQTANNNILLRFGSHRYHPDLGNKVFTRRIKKNQSGLDDIAFESKNAILNDSRVISVEKVNVSTIQDSTTCVVSYILMFETYENGEKVQRRIDGRVDVNVFNMESGE